MRIEDYIVAIEKIKEMQEETNNAIAFVLGALKGELFKAKKMPRRIMQPT